MVTMSILSYLTLGMCTTFIMMHTFHFILQAISLSYETIEAKIATT